MPTLSFQKFRNSVVEAQGFTELAPARRARIVNIVIGNWKFGGEELTEKEIEKLFGKRMSYSERKYARTTAETIKAVLATDPSALSEIWNFSEIAHDIEEQRDVEKSRNRRTYRIVDGPQELPGFPGPEAE